MTGPGPLLLPDPSLVDAGAGIALRPWGAADAPALVSAWATPDIAGQATVPGSGGPEDAMRWIDGAATRREVGLALDLVVGPIDGDAVWGEVGLARIRLTSGAATRDELEIGWWVLPEHRGRGIAAAAAALLARWAFAELGAPRLVARIDRGATASESVAERIGFQRLGPLDPARVLWAVHDVPGPS